MNILLLAEATYDWVADIRKMLASIFVIFGAMAVVGLITTMSAVYEGATAKRRLMAGIILLVVGLVPVVGVLGVFISYLFAHR